MIQLSLSDVERIDRAVRFVEKLYDFRGISAPSERQGPPGGNVEPIFVRVTSTTLDPVSGYYAAYVAQRFLGTWIRLADCWFLQANDEPVGLRRYQSRRITTHTDGKPVFCASEMIAGGGGEGDDVLADHTHAGDVSYDAIYNGTAIGTPQWLGAGIKRIDMLQVDFRHLDTNGGTGLTNNILNRARGITSEGNTDGRQFGAAGGSDDNVAAFFGYDNTTIPGARIALKGLAGFPPTSFNNTASEEASGYFVVNGFDPTGDPGNPASGYATGFADRGGYGVFDPDTSTRKYGQWATDAIGNVFKGGILTFRKTVVGSPSTGDSLVYSGGTWTYAAPGGNLDPYSVLGNDTGSSAPGVSISATDGNGSGPLFFDDNANTVRFWQAPTDSPGFIFWDTTPTAYDIVPVVHGGTGSDLSGTFSPGYVYQGTAGGPFSVTSDPGFNAIAGWDDTDNLPAFFHIGTGLSYNHSTHTLSASGATPGGSNGSVQFNDSSTLGGSNYWFWNEVTGTWIMSDPGGTGSTIEVGSAANAANSLGRFWYLTGGGGNLQTDICNYTNSYCLQCYNGVFTVELCNGSEAIKILGTSNGAGIATGTLTNAPTSGNPSYWLPIRVAGTLRYVPCW